MSALGGVGLSRPAVQLTNTAATVESGGLAAKINSCAQVVFGAISTAVYAVGQAANSLALRCQSLYLGKLQKGGPELTAYMVWAQVRFIESAMKDEALGGEWTNKAKELFGGASEAAKESYVKRFPRDVQKTKVEKIPEMIRYAEPEVQLELLKTPGGITKYSLYLTPEVFDGLLEKLLCDDNNDIKIKTEIVLKDLESSELLSAKDAVEILNDSVQESLEKYLNEKITTIVVSEVDMLKDLVIPDVADGGYAPVDYGVNKEVLQKTPAIQQVYYVKKHGQKTLEGCSSDVQHAFINKDANEYTRYVSKSVLEACIKLDREFLFNQSLDNQVLIVEKFPEMLSHVTDAAKARYVIIQDPEELEKASKKIQEEFLNKKTPGKYVTHVSIGVLQDKIAASPSFLKDQTEETQKAVVVKYPSMLQSIVSRVQEEVIKENPTLYLQHAADDIQEQYIREDRENLISR